MKYAILIGLFLATPAQAEYLGKLSANPYAYESTSNPYGPYGSKYSYNSINNQYGPYGSPYSDTSVNNPYASSPPSIYGDSLIGE
jgi:hypothetical protein